MPKHEVYDHTDTYEEVITLLAKKIHAICDAHGIPYLMAFQVQRTSNSALTLGSSHVPPHTGDIIKAATLIISSRDQEEFDRRIMSLAASVALENIKGQHNELLKEKFEANSGPGGETPEKEDRLN
jgi:hypothetical protein